MGSYTKKTAAALVAAEKGKGDEKMLAAAAATAMTATTAVPPTTPAASSVSSSNPTRSVKQFLHEVVRDDWQFPPPTVPVVWIKPNKNGKDHATQRDVVAWRCREEGLSDIENDRDIISSRRRASSWANIRPGSALYDYQNVNHQNSAVVDDCSGNPYKFDTPDAVGDFVRERRQKRRRLVTEECMWNDGLRNWIRQRDTWTGAVERKELRQVEGGETKAQQDQQQQRQQKGKSRTWHVRNESGGTMDSVPFSSGSVVSHEPPAHDASSSLTSADDISHNLLVVTAATGKEREKTEQEEEKEEEEEEEDGDGDGGSCSGSDLLGPYLPIYPSLFDEDHVLRSRIQPLAYPVIYSKVVIQSLTPNIPIPLTHMTKILVEGWKSEGNWPPGDTQAAATATAAAAAAANKSGRSARFLRWKRERAAARDARYATMTSAIAAEGVVVAAAADDGKEGEAAGSGCGASGGGRRERVRKSISFAVKRGLGLGLDSHGHGYGYSHSSKAGAPAEAGKAERVFGRKSKNDQDMDVGIEFREHSGDEEENGQQEMAEEEQREASHVY